jgi:hypothetical protein
VSLAARVAELQWWHTLDLAPGVITPGCWDLPRDGRSPALLDGLGCLDVAGFTVEAMTPILRDRAGPAIRPGSLPPTVAARHALGIPGRSVALRARAPRA